MSGNRQQNYINHIALVLDASSSMHRHQRQLVEVADRQIAALAEESKRLDQETRVSIWSFDHRVKCLVWDKDVLRLPSIKNLYKVDGATALVEASLTSIRDLEHTWEMYGDHSFLIFVITDGEENASGGSFHYDSDLFVSQWRDPLHKKLESLPDNWTVAALVPDILAKRKAATYGFPTGNIAVWDADSDRGAEEVIQQVSAATSTYMKARSTGVRGSRSLFVGGQVDAAAIKAAKLKPMATSDYAIVPVTPVDGLVKEKPDPALKKPPAGKPDTRPLVPYMEIEPFIQRVRPPFRVGECYYELVKAESIKGNKQLAILDKKTSKIYLGDGVRQMLGLPEENKTVRPDFNKDYTIYVQSTSLNRHLYLHSSVMVLTK